MTFEIDRRTMLKLAGAAAVTSGFGAGTAAAVDCPLPFEPAVGVELEGPLTAVSPDGTTITVMSVPNVPGSGITVDVSSATVSSPTTTFTEWTSSQGNPDLTVSDFLLGDPFPGRGTTPGFLHGTAIVTGTSDGITVTAEDLFVEVSETVALGPLTHSGSVSGSDLLEIQGLKVHEVGDSRMPFTATSEGFEIDPRDIPCGALTAAEGHLGNDGILYAHTVEADQAAVDGVQTSISRVRCEDGGRLEVRGSSTALGGEVTLFVTYESTDDPDDMAWVEVDSQNVDPDPEANLGFFRFRVDVDDLPDGCPESVLVKHINGSYAIA